MAEISTQEVHTRAQWALATSSIYEIRTLCVEQVGNSLEIFGQVSSYYHKQLAQEIVRAVANGTQVANLIYVTQEDLAMGSRMPVR